jgi:pilus assembly protein Flp/PilA
VQNFNRPATWLPLAAFEDRKGVTAIEYGLIAGLIAVAIIVAVTLLGGNLGNLFTFLGNGFGNVARS